MDFFSLGMWELWELCECSPALMAEGAGSKLQEGVRASSGGRKNVVFVALSLCCIWSWFKRSEAIVLLSTNQTAARGAGSSLDPFSVANRHNLHESIATAEKVKYETASPPWLVRKYQVLASLDTCSNWLLSSTSPKTFSFPASNFLLGKRHKREGKWRRKQAKIIQIQSVSTAKCSAGYVLGGGKKWSFQGRVYFWGSYSCHVWFQHCLLSWEKRASGRCANILRVLRGDGKSQWCRVVMWLRQIILLFPSPPPKPAIRLRELNILE